MHIVPNFGSVDPEAVEAISGSVRFPTGFGPVSASVRIFDGSRWFGSVSGYFKG